MLWPLLLDREPMAEPWSVGDTVSRVLSWWDEPRLSAGLIGTGADFEARELRLAAGELFGQVLTSGRVTAVRREGRGGGRLRLTGCLVYDRYLWEPPGSIAPTEGVIRTIRVVSELHERSTGRWVPRPGDVRATEVPDTSPRHLRDDPPYPTARDWTDPPDPSTLRLVREEEYLRIAGDRLPAEQWRPRGFLVELEVD